MIGFLFGFFLGFGISNEIHRPTQLQAIPTVNVVVECKYDGRENKTPSDNINVNNGESFKEYLERLKTKWKLI